MSIRDKQPRLSATEAKVLKVFMADVNRALAPAEAVVLLGGRVKFDIAHVFRALTRAGFIYESPSEVHTISRWEDDKTAYTQTRYRLEP